MQITGTQKPFIAVKIVSLLLMLVLIFCAGMVTAHGQVIYPPVNIFAYLDGPCETPPNGSAYTGTAVMSYSVYGSNPPVSCTVTLPANFPAVDIGIYGPATPFQAAPLLFDLGQPGLVTNVVVVLSFGSWTFSTNVNPGCTTNLSLTPQQINDLNAGLLYVNVTSAAYPEGEIRGQFSTQPILSQPASENGNGVAFNVTFAEQLNQPQALLQPNYEDYEVQESTDLLNWTTFTNFQSTNIAFQVVDTEAAITNGSRFYRVKVDGYF
jgi:CHRD domain